ncbi:glycosyltransferase family 4 protein [Bacillus sp. JJ1533]|uniref:glycosyltransferase family 4 protein n=1 Tax=Bacillus sp. JJ1533 TaxID=3122959 RepID=UPI002FFDE988
MNIAFICTEKLPSPAIKGGAIQTMIDGIAPFLILNHNLTIYSITDPCLPETEIIDGVNYIRFPLDLYEYKVATELKKKRFDVIHVFNRPIYIPMYKNAAPNSKFILSLHNDMFSELKITPNRAEMAIELVDKITTVSEYIKRAVVERYPTANDKVHVVYSGIDLKKFHTQWSKEGKLIRQQIRRNLDIDNKKVILFIGRLSKAKGPHILIKAMNNVLSYFDDAVLLIVGGKWFSENGTNTYIQELQALSKQFKNNIKFTNYLPSEQIPEMLVAADVFVCSSQWHEPLARVHYEAMAAGIPIITTNRGGNPEVITHEENGLIVSDFRNPAAFSSAIVQILSDHKLANSLSKKGRAIVEKQFQFQHVAERYETVYLQSFPEYVK